MNNSNSFQQKSTLDKGKASDASFLLKNDIKLFQNKSNKINTTLESKNNTNDNNNNNKNIHMSESIQNTEYRRKSDTDILKNNSTDIGKVRQKLLEYAQVIDTVSGEEQSISTNFSKVRHEDQAFSKTKEDANRTANIDNSLTSRTNRDVANIDVTATSKSIVTSV